VPIFRIALKTAPENLTAEKKFLKITKEAGEVPAIIGAELEIMAELVTLVVGPEVALSSRQRRYVLWLSMRKKGKLDTYRSESILYQ